MISSLITFLIGCIVLAVVIYVFSLILGMIALPPQVKQIVLIVVGLIFLLILLGLAFGGLGGETIGWR